MSAELGEALLADLPCGKFKIFLSDLTLVFGHHGVFCFFVCLFQFCTFCYMSVNRKILLTLVHKNLTHVFVVGDTIFLFLVLVSTQGFSV